MIDPTPIGYIEVNQAALRRAADISDREYQERMHRFREQMRRLNVAIGKSSENNEIDPAARPWGKREFAISDLRTALCDGSLLALVRDPASGQMFRLTTSDWGGAVFWRDIIVSGVVRSSACEEIERYDGRRVLIEETVLAAWRKKMTERKPEVFADDCQAWLEGEMRASPKRNQTKDYWRAQAKKKFGVSGRAFERIWPTAIKNTGAQWDRPGAPYKVR